MNLKYFFQRLIDTSIIIIFIFAPISITFEIFDVTDLVHPIIGAQISLSDLLITFTLLFWLVKVILFKEIKSVMLPPLPVFIFLGVGFISCINAYSIKDWLKEFIQLIEYFFIFYILLINNPNFIKSKKHFLNILLVISSVTILLAAYQHFFQNGSPYLIRSFFNNRNIFDCFLALILPLFYSEVLFGRLRGKQIWIFIIFILTIFVFLAPEMLIILIPGLAIMSWLESNRIFCICLTSMLITALTGPLFLPKKNIVSFNDFLSVYEQGDINQNYNRIQTILYDLTKFNIYELYWNNKYLRISNNIFMSSLIPENRNNNQRYADFKGERHIKQRYLEWQAALNMLESHFVFGVGLGNFQEHIGEYYKELPKVNTTEPNTQNGWLIIAASTGILGLSAFIAIILKGIQKTYSQYKQIQSNEEKKWFLGIFGALITAALANIFVPVMSSGVIVILILLVSHINEPIKNQPPTDC